MADVGSNSQTKHYPKDGLVIISIMKELGITSYEPRVITQLLEFTFRYVSCVLDDARAFANHTKKKSIDNEDVKLAVTMQLERVFTSPPPRDLLLEVARSKNNTPLPLVKPHCGIRLPPDRYCFSSCNYRLKSSTKKFNEFQSKFGMTTPGLSSKSPAVVVPTAGIKRPVNVAGVARTQPTTTVISTKPVAKFTTNPVIINTAAQKARAITAPSTGQVEMKLEPQETTGIKRKREDD